MSEARMKILERVVYASLELVADVRITWHETIEIAVDDPFIEKLDQTVTLGRREQDSVSRKTGEHFPGAVVGFVSAWERHGDGAEPVEQIVTASYVVAVPYRDFVDESTGVESDEALSWARIRFEMTCPACGEDHASSSQNNVRVPREIRCACGTLLATETQAQPLFAPVQRREFTPSPGQHT